MILQVSLLSYLATTLRQIPRDPNSTDKNAEKIEPMPSLTDVRRLVTEHCILPLGTTLTHTYDNDACIYMYIGQNYTTGVIYYMY